MGNLTDVDRQYLAENIIAILRRDYQAAVDAHIRAGWAPHDISLQRFEVSIRTVCEQYVNQPVGEISFGRLMGRMFRMTREFGINIQPQLLLFQKTYLNLEGLTRMLDPELDISKTVRPVLESWARQRFSVGRLNENIKMESPHWISVAPEIPRLVHSVLSNMQENQMREQEHRQWAFIARIGCEIQGALFCTARQRNTHRCYSGLEQRWIWISYTLAGRRFRRLFEYCLATQEELIWIFS